MNSFKEIGTHQTKEKADAGEANIVDIRDPGSYAMGHIPGAQHISDANVANFVANTDKGKPLIVYCYHGQSSQGAAAYFAQQGFREVYSMAGGFEAWNYVFPSEQEIY